MINEVSFEVLDIYLKIFLLLYADDTVFMSENVDGMQTMLNVFYFCHIPTLHIVSSALLKSMKVKNSFFFVERYKSIRLCKIKILSAVELAYLNPDRADDNKPISSFKLANLLFSMPVNYFFVIHVLCYITELDVLEMIYMYIHKLNYKIRRV
jgi:hypothetical protein